MRKIAFRGYCLNGCGNPILSRSLKAKYCSAACAKLRFEQRRGNCAHCGKKLRCSFTCQHERQFQLRAAKLESGAYPTYSCNQFIRRYLIHRLGEQCSRCGWAERHPKTGRVPIEVEHIDGNYENNHPDNLTLLCPNCHSLTNTFRALNRGRAGHNALADERIPGRLALCSRSRKRRGAIRAGAPTLRSG